MWERILKRPGPGCKGCVSDVVSYLDPMGQLFSNNTS